MDEIKAHIRSTVMPMLKGKFHRVMDRPALLYGVECLAYQECPHLKDECSRDEDA